jgi:hypothetical protein
MPHVTFVHGIGNKPPAEQLSGIWRGALAANGLDLDARGVSSSMVYWADLLNAKPLAESQLEAADDPELAAVPDVGMLWAVRAQGEEALFVERLAHAIGYEDPAARAQVFEAWGPAGWPTQRLMELFLRDVHHYLFDVEFSPRPDETYRIRQEVRKRTIEALSRGSEQSGPHVLVGHSLGTVIGYDCLTRVPDCPGVNGFLTIGSPLGLDVVQDRLLPEWTPRDGFPSARLRGRWVNVYDGLDPVAGFDALLADDFQRDGVVAIDDIEEPNSGGWRHSIVKYLAGPRLSGELQRLLGVGEET